MYKWLCVNKLSFNIATSNYILVGRHTHQQNVAIIINNVTILRVQATKFLGVLIDESLNWKNHINFVRFMYELGWIAVRRRLMMMVCVCGGGGAKSEVTVFIKSLKTYLFIIHFD